MSKKHFSWLLVLTIAAAVVIGFLPEPTGRDASYEPEPLLPGLADQVNDIDEIVVTRGGGETVATLSREPGRWTVAEADGYAADWEKLRGLLAALAQSVVVEPKTANPGYFERLGLRDVTDPGSAAIRIRLGSGDGAPAVLIGNAASNRDGQYVRLENGERALLVDRTLDVPAQTRDWLDRDIVDIPEDEVVEAVIEHPEGETVRLTKTSANDADFTLANVPDGREAQSTWTVNAPAGGLSGLRLDEVRAADAVSFEAPVRYSLLTADGLRIEAELAEADDRHWIRLTASVHPTGDADSDGGQVNDGEGSAAEADAADGASDDSGTGSAEAGDDDTDSGATPAARAAAINERVAGWAYAIPKYKYDLLTKALEDLLKPLPEPEE